MAKAAIPLILLYGFKIGTIAEIKTSSFSQDTRRLKLQLKDQDIWLELSYKVFLNVNKVYTKNASHKYLFDTADNQRLVSDYFDDVINKSNQKFKKKTKVTLDGLSKYAVINMFLAGINPIVIGQISGMKEMNLKYCQKIAWDKTKRNLKRLW